MKMGGKTAFIMRARMRSLSIVCLNSVQAWLSIQICRRTFTALTMRRRCSPRNSNCLGKFVVSLVLFVLLPLAFIIKYMTLESAILQIPIELDPVLHGLPTPVKQYILDYKSMCESYVFTSARYQSGVAHSQRTMLDSLNSRDYHYGIGRHKNTTHRKLLGYFMDTNRSHSDVNAGNHGDTPRASKVRNRFIIRGVVSSSRVRSRHFCPCVPLEEQTLSTEAVPEYMALPWRHIENHVSNLKVNVSLGGIGHPSTCVPRQRIAIIIPYRDREQHLKAFLAVMHPFLQRQDLHYQIFVIEQKSPLIFNRAALMNVGYLEAKRHGPFDCYVYQDVDLLPESDLNLYSCYNTPLHLGAYMNKFDYEMPYEGFFGGAMVLTGAEVEAINGFPNRFYGWGGEDDDIYMRVLKHNFTIKKHPLEIGRTFMIKHRQDKMNPNNPLRFAYIERPNLEDGLSTLKYRRHETAKRKLYTWVLASLEPKYEDECIIDPSLAPDVEGNYLNCYSEENFETWSLECCHDNSTVFCCNKTKKQTNVILPCVIVSLLIFGGAILWRKYLSSWLNPIKILHGGQSQVLPYKPPLPWLRS